MRVTDRQQSNQSNKIIEVATRLYARYSYAKVTLEEVASKLDLVPGAIYHYFEDKEDLIFHCYMNGLNIYAQEIDDCIEDGLDALEIVRRFIRQRFDPKKPRMVLFTDIDALDQEKSKAVHLKRYENAKQLASIIERGVKEGSISSDNPFLTAIAIFSILDWTPFWLSEKSYYTYQEAVEGIDDIITHGVYRRDIPRLQFPESPDLTPLLEKRARMGKRLARVDHILKVAADNFNRKGALGVSIKEIAADAGVTRAGIYYHFEDKETLLYRCLERGLQMEIDVGDTIKQDQWFEAQNTRALFLIHSTDYGPCLTYHNVSFLKEEHRKKFMQDIYDGQLQCQERYQKNIDKGIYRNIDTYFAYRITSGLHHWYAIWFRDQKNLTPETIADHFMSLFLFGLKPR
ncbi:TetR family transcriptional regulator [Emcibacter sp.]|uniref:TetR family transcriptional regulator n=1 Tax=Emcibacter sp. TaxID=1979954 RepID=UPI003A8FDC65